LPITSSTSARLSRLAAEVLLDRTLTLFDFDWGLDLALLELSLVGWGEICK
jgi:hypothetical protein